MAVGLGTGFGFLGGLGAVVGVAVKTAVKAATGDLEVAIAVAAAKLKK